MKLSPPDQAKDDEARSLFRPGIYRHYCGGEYLAVGLTRHHDTRRTYVIYVSMTNGSMNVRPLVKLEGLLCPGGDDQDCWMDELIVDRLQQGPAVPRFRYVGPLP